MLIIYKIYSRLTFSQSSGIQKIEKERPLVLFFNPDNLLRDVLRGWADAADGQEDVVAQEVASQNLKWRKENYFYDTS